MSLIHQALKKAQRERLRHEVRPGSYTTRRASSRPSRRWVVFAAGLVLALGGGAVLHGWFPLLSRRPPHAVQAPPAAHQARMAAQSAPLIPVTNRVPPSPPGSAPSPAMGTAETFAAIERTVTAAPQPGLTRPSVPPTTQETPASESEPAAPSPPARRQALTVFRRAVALQQSGDEARALASLKRAIALDPTLKDAYNVMGNLYYRRGQYTDALAAYQNALGIDPDFVKARNNLGSTYLRLARIDRAREELHKVVQADDSYGLAYYNLACVYARGGDSAAAARYLQRAMQLEPEARSWALTDDDFTSVRTTPELQRLLGPS